MNPIEQLAHAWLMGEGYTAADITYQYARSPDFLTTDAHGWEVKRLIRSAANFYARQVCDLREHGNTTVLFWRDGEPSPTATATFGDLTLPGEWDGLRLHVYWQPDRHIPIRLLTPAAVNEIVERYTAQAFRRKALPLTVATT